jgi:hypothetical protein
VSARQMLSEPPPSVKHDERVAPELWAKVGDGIRR